VAAREAAREALGRPATPRAARLTPEERKQVLGEHQKAMEAHRERMAVWRAGHEGRMAERRAVADGYRDLAAAVREATARGTELRR